MQNKTPSRIALAAFVVTAFALVGCQQQPAATSTQSAAPESTGAQSMSLSIVAPPTQQTITQQATMGLNIAPSQQMTHQTTSTTSKKSTK